MRILLVTPMPPRQQAPGAIPLVLHAQLQGLSLHHTVTLATIAGPDPAERAAVARLRAAGFEVHAALRSNARRFGNMRTQWRVVSKWVGSRYPRRTAWFWDHRMQELLDELLARREFDLLQIEDNAMGAYRYRTNAPTVFTEHEVRRPRTLTLRPQAGESRAHAALRELDWQRWPGYQRQVWSQFDRIQVFTARDGEAIRTMAPQLAARVRVNPFGVELPAAADVTQENGQNILFVGNFTHAPNVDGALWLGHEIMPRLRERAPGTRLSLVGVLPPPSVRELACDDIEVTGAVPAIEPWLTRAAVVLAPLRIGGGMRMKVLHSMAMGKAVVTTPRGAEGLSVDGCQPPLVVAADTEAMVQATATLLGSPATRRALGLRARTFVAQHFSPQAYVRRLEAVYAELQPGSSGGM